MPYPLDTEQFNQLLHYIDYLIAVRSEQRHPAREEATLRSLSDMKEALRRVLVGPGGGGDRDF